MKKIFFFTLALFATAFFSQSVKAQTEAQRIELCAKVANATMQGSYAVQLHAANAGERPPDFKQGFALRTKNKYRITVCTDEESPGEATIRLIDEAKVVGTNVTPDGKILQSFDFDCTKSAPYLIIVSIKDGREGSAIIIISHVKTL